MSDSSITRRTLSLGAVASMAVLNMVEAQSPAATNDGATPKAATPMAVSEQLQHATIQIKATNAKGELSSGTGFFFGFFNFQGQSAISVVTNKHVVSDQKTVSLRWTLRNADGRPDYGKFIDYNIQNFSDIWIPHPDPNVDLAAFPVADIINQITTSQGRPPFWISLDPSILATSEELKSLQPLEDVLIVGYPNGISDLVNNIPIFRRGITATPAYMNFNGQKKFLIDAAIFPGSSGSPTLLFNQGSYGNGEGGLVLGTRVKLIGIVAQVALHAASGDIHIVPAPTQSRQIAVSQIPNNLGICIHANELYGFEPEILKRGYVLPTGYIPSPR